jgi:ABC-type branched-subunit amino acid transport system substrate-binding protein
VRREPALLLVVAVLAGCGHSSGQRSHTLLIVVNAPFSRTPYLGKAIDDGARLAAAGQGVYVNGTSYGVRIRTMDTGLSAARAVANVRHAVADGAIAIVDEGTGVNASWRVAAAKGVPIGIVFEGGEGLVDPAARRNVFRVAPTDHGIAFRLAEYLVPKGVKLGVLHDDSDYGAAGAVALRDAFSQNRSSIVADETVPSDALDLGPQVLRARRVHATALLVWGRPATIAAAITAARSAGWKVPFYTPPTGADPFVRQELADHPSWLDGLTFASGRLTAEIGANPFNSFAQQLERAYGLEKVGVRTHAGDEVVQPPETAMYAYDFVNLAAAAVVKAQSTQPAKVAAALEQVSIEGANGDSRSFNRHNHEGVVDDDVYFARFHDMTYAPVRDDPLSSTLPTIPQTR